MPVKIAAGKPVVFRRVTRHKKFMKFIKIKEYVQKFRKSELKTGHEKFWSFRKKKSKKKRKIKIYLKGL